MASKFLANGLPSGRLPLRERLVSVGQVESELLRGTRLVKRAVMDPTSPHMLNIDSVGKLLKRHPAKHIGLPARVGSLRKCH
jgi:hypothetical protein